MASPGAEQSVVCGPPGILSALGWSTAVAVAAAAPGCPVIYPDPGNDVIGPPPAPFPHPRGSGPSSLHLQTHLWLPLASTAHS
jgi:hypothetical protein